MLWRIWSLTLPRRPNVKRDVESASVQVVWPSLSASAAAIISASSFSRPSAEGLAVDSQRSLNNQRTAGRKQGKTFDRVLRIDRIAAPDCRERRETPPPERPPEWPSAPGRSPRKSGPRLSNT